MSDEMWVNVGGSEEEEEEGGVCSSEHVVNIHAVHRMHDFIIRYSISNGRIT